MGSGNREVEGEADEEVSGGWAAQILKGLRPGVDSQVREYVSNCFYISKGKIIPDVGVITVKRSPQSRCQRSREGQGQEQGHVDR